MTLRIPLAKRRYMTVVSAYAPTQTSDDTAKDNFYAALHTTLRSIPSQDKITTLGDFKARVCRDHTVWDGVIGRHGKGNFNSNGLQLLQTCAEFDLTITNTLFQMRNQQKTTWMHPRSKHWHLLDYVIVRRTDARDVLSTKAMRGAECWTDHRLVRASMRLHIRPPARKQKPNRRLNIKACNDPVTKVKLSQAILTKLHAVPDSDPSETRTTASLTEEWSQLSKGILEASVETLGYTARKHQDWFDDNNSTIRELLKAKNDAHSASLRSPVCTELCDK